MWTLGQFLVLSFYTHCRVNTLSLSDSAGGFLEGGQQAGAPPPRWPRTPPTDTDTVCGQVFEPRRGRDGRSVTSPDPNQRRRSVAAGALPPAHLRVRSPTRSPSTHWLVSVSEEQARREIWTPCCLCHRCSPFYVSALKNVSFTDRSALTFTQPACQFWSSSSPGHDILEAWIPSLTGAGSLSSCVQVIP